VFNNLFTNFFDHIPEVTKPVVLIQQSFRKHGLFLTF
jgi:hypothetical protein